MTEVETINKHLAKFGKVKFSDFPRWRVVWSEDQFEHRIGVFHEFTGGILIRVVKGIQEVRKYPYLRERWILERFLAADEGGYHPDIPNSRRGSYEPIFPFEDGDGNPLPLNLKATIFMVQAAESPATKMTESELKNILLAKEEKEVQEIFESLGEN